MRRDYFNPLCILVGATIFVATASAQPAPSIDPAFANQAIATLQQQRNKAADESAQANTLLILEQMKTAQLQAENKSLKEQLDKAKAAAAPATPVPPQTAVPSEQGK